MSRPRPLVLMILDGFGERKERDANAVRMANTPSMDRLFAEHAHTLIGASGPDVGLPEGQMGNSEVGHLSFGAGRIAKMDITRIDDAIADGSFTTNAALAGAIAKAKSQGGAVHVFGLVSDGGVHSQLTHIQALCTAVQAAGVQVWVHAFTDGRDVAPGSAPGFVRALETTLAQNSAKPGFGNGGVATVSGRYYAMDRDNRWDRVERAYRAIVHAEGGAQNSAESGLSASIDAGKTDEFVVPFVIPGYPGVDRARDVGIHANFRPDRARELTHALTQEAFAEFPREGGAPLPSFACMTNYDATLVGLPVAFPKQAYPNTLPEVLASHGLRQFRCAETEKYAHVTYFFNGGREKPFEGEDRKLVPSPKDVATYDEKPAMSAKAVTDEVVQAIQSERYDFVLINFANPDMVGHTGDLNAAILAVEAVDEGVGRIAEATLGKGGVLMLTADHGNCETMVDPTTGKPHTAHTLNPVPFICVQNARKFSGLREGGRIADVAPTILALLDLPVPSEMTGKSLLI